MSKSSILLTGLFVSWLLASGLGFLALGAYHATPGSRGLAPDRWPSDSPIPLDKSLPTLLIFIHPRCPCSSASMAELEQVLTRCRGRFAAHVITYRPDGASEDWETSERNSDIPPVGLSRRGDPGGREAMRFGVETSGHVLVFDPSGRKLFSGGITISRGHRGDNPGLDRLIATIQEGATGPRSSPVFGCSVLNPASDRSGRSVP